MEILSGLYERLNRSLPLVLTAGKAYGVYQSGNNGFGMPGDQYEVRYSFVREEGDPKVVLAPVKGLKLLDRASVLHLTEDSKGRVTKVENIYGNVYTSPRGLLLIERSTDNTLVPVLNHVFAGIAGRVTRWFDPKESGTIVDL